MKIKIGDTAIRVQPKPHHWFTEKNRCLCFFVTILVLLCNADVTAAEPADNSAENTFSDMSLDELMGLEVFSAATRIPTRQAQAAGTVYSFDRSDFARMGVRRVDDLLQFVPGMQLNQHRKRHRSIWSRGLISRYNDKLILMVDGVQVRHLYYGHFSLGDNFPLEKIEKVEIIQGPASSLYGANAFGGIISITTRSFVKDSDIELTAELGNHDRKKVTALASASAIQVFGSRLEQDAPFREDRNSFIGGDTLQPLDEDYSNVFIKGAPLEGLTLSVDFHDSETPFLFIPDTQDAFVEEQSITLSARYEAGDLQRGKLETTFYYTQDNAREYELEQVTQSLGYQENQDATIFGASVTGFKQLFEEHVFALGLNWQHEQAEDMDFVRYYRYDTGFIDPPITGSLLSEPDISNDDYAVFLQDVWRINDRLNLTLGARYDYFEQFDGYVNYRGALVYMPDLQQTWKLLYGTAIRTPSYREYLKVLENTTFVAPVPDPERIRSLELAYLHQWQRTNLNITLYHNEVDDFIYEVPTPDGGDEYFANSGETINMNGIDALLTYSLQEDLMLRLNASYLDAESIGVDDMPYLATWSAGFNLSYAYSSNHNLGFSVVYNSEREDTNTYTDDDPGSFALVNVFGSGQITPELSYGYGVDNVFDERVYDSAADFGSQYNTERAERELWINLKWSPAP
jgi:outer membrane receptor for ferrienterochelin and colicin